jgi:polyribonucleotide nucleotidyltransferase
MRSRLQAQARLANSASPPARPRQKDAAPSVPRQKDAAPSVARQKDAAPSVPRQKDAAPSVPRQKDADPSAPRHDVAAFVNEDTLHIPADKVPTLIGHKGFTISGIESKSGTRIHVEADGTVSISSGDTASVRRARELIEDLIKGKANPSSVVQEIPVGATYSATVVTIKEYGCFVRLPSGQEVMVHISELELGRVAKVEDVVKIGDVILVKCIGKDKEGRTKMSRKATIGERGGGAAGA